MKLAKLIFLILLSILPIFIFSCRDIPADKSAMLGDDFRLFQGTIAWDLAKAVEDQDIEEIKRQVTTLKVPVDYKEEKFGGTLLIISVRTNKKKSVKTLLELGADPNMANDTLHNFGRNAVIFASAFESPQMLKLLLEHGGDPNSVERGVQQDNLGKWIPARHFALYDAVPLSMERDFEKVRILVEAGADVNMQTEDTGAGAIEAAIIHDRMDVLLYLLEHGGDYHKKFERFNLDSPSPSPYNVDILYMLRLCIYPIGSKEHKYKLKVIDFLRKRGLDYKSSEIPNNAIAIIKRIINPKTEKELKEYIQKY